jgi:hypothetical protein
MPHVQGVSKSQTAYPQSRVEIQVKAPVVLSDASTLARYDQKSRLREPSSGGTIVSCLQWILAALAACFTLKWCFGSKPEQKKEQTARAQAPTRPTPTHRVEKDDNDAESQKSALEKKEIEAKIKKTIAEAIQKGIEKAQRHIKLARTDKEPRLTGNDYGKVLTRDSQAVDLLMKGIISPRGKYVAFYTYANHYLNGANNYLKGELEKLRRDQEHNVDTAVVNLLRTAFSFMINNPLYGDDTLNFGLSDHFKELSDKYGVIDTSNILCIQTLELCQQSYEIFKDAVGLNAKDPARWEKLKTTSLGYVDELFKEKLLILDQKKTNVIAHDVQHPLDRLSDKSGFTQDQIPRCLHKEEVKS